MAMTVKRRKDKRRVKVLLHRVADIRGGVGIKTADLGGDFLEEGTVIGSPENNLYQVLKTAVISKDLTASGKNIQVKKGSHFKVDDNIGKIGGKAAKITKIDKSAADKDTITIAAELGKLDKGTVLTQAESDGDNAKAKIEPIAITGTGENVVKNDNLWTDAWVIAVAQGAPIDKKVAAELKGIVNL